MKKNHEKLTDAIGMLNQETVHECFAERSREHRVLNGRRTVALIAACLSLMLMVGAVVALPLMQIGEPLSPTVSNTDPAPSDPLTTGHPTLSTEGDDLVTTPPPSIFEELSYQEAPLVNIQILSERQDTDVQPPHTENETAGPAMDDKFPELETSESETVAPEHAPDQNVSVLVGDAVVSHNVYLLFYTEAGETVTVTSQNGKIGQGAMPTGLDTTDDWEAVFTEYSPYTGLICAKNCGKTLVVDPEFPVVTWGGNRFYPENPLGARADEEYIDFIIRDENSLITGAGSVYLGNKKPLNNEKSRYYDAVSITRGVVLGAARFDEPEKVTEAQVEAFILALHDHAEDVKPTLFEGFTMTEQFVVALGDLINQNYGEFNNFGMASGYASGNTYLNVTVFDSMNLEIGERSYLLLEDGSWVEYSRRVYACDLCGKIEDRCYHNTVERYLLTDGRVLEDRNGKLIVPETQTPNTAEQVLADMILEGSPMKDAIMSGYAGLVAENEGLLPAGVIHQKVSMVEGLWNRYAILMICEKGQTLNDPTKRYFITENGDCFEIVREIYPCAHCGVILDSEEAVEIHGGYSDYGVGYLLADGRVVTVESGWGGYTGQEQTYAPEFKDLES
ncbi:MAG: hypothetical protein E7645_01350 [Ruminococcaceae bacterium]|nr:hypothetical protein [Oscillospiraceae bacterium]